MGRRGHGDRDFRPHLPCECDGAGSQPDGSGYHLGLVARYLREHGLNRITTNMYANLSQGAEMLFLFAFAFGRHSAAALVHLAFTFALAAGMICYGRGRHPGGRHRWSGSGLHKSVVGVDGSSAYVDVAVAGILFSLYYVLQSGTRSGQTACSRSRGCWLASAMPSSTRVSRCPVRARFVGWRLLRERKPIVRPVLVVAGCSLLMMSPWLIRNWIWFANPFSPFLNRVFPNPYVHIGMEAEYVRLLRQFPVKDAWAIPFELTVRGGVLNGLLGPVFLLAPLALLALPRNTDAASCWQLWCSRCHTPPMWARAS